MTPKQTQEFAQLVQAVKTIITKVNEVVGRMDELENALDEILKHPVLSVPPTPSLPGSLDET